MFEPFYNFRHTPFSRDIPTDQLYMSHALIDILGRLKYAAERQWFAVVTGDCGTGKTTTAGGSLRHWNNLNSRFCTFRTPN